MSKTLHKVMLLCRGKSIGGKPLFRPPIKGPIYGLHPACAQIVNCQSLAISLEMRYCKTFSAVGMLSLCHLHPRKKPIACDFRSHANHAFPRPQKPRFWVGGCQDCNCNCKVSCQMRLFCLQLEASCLQLSFFACGCV